MKWLHVILLIVLICGPISWNQALNNGWKPEVSNHISKGPIMDGITLVAPPRPFSENPMTELKEVGAGWVAVVPYAFSALGGSQVHYSNSQYWGETPVGAKETVRLAKEAGLKVMLKPQVWIRGSWPGDIRFDKGEEFQYWWESYKKYINEYVDIAIEYEVELLCLGTEFKQLTLDYPEAWIELIKDVRNRYSGKITYAANWDEYKHITFWGQLDYIGVDAYFPLINAKCPPISELEQAWQPYLQEMEALSRKVDRPILFTEYGYLNVEGCTWNTWELEARLGSTAADENAQAQALEALYQVCWEEDWWVGGFIWKWFSQGGNRRSKGYTPQGKKAETVLSAWYKKV